MHSDIHAESEFRYKHSRSHAPIPFLKKCLSTYFSDDGSSMTSIDYSCTLTPLFSLELLSNQSYILQLSFSPQSSNKSYDLFGLTTRAVTVQKAALTLVIESSAFHSAIFYLKCFCLPFVLGALVIFSIRLYLNDLYVSIPDRLLITCALAQTLHNIPVEALIAEGNFWPASPYMKLIDELGRFVLITCLFIFWVVYTKDKVRSRFYFCCSSPYHDAQCLKTISQHYFAAEN